MPKARISRGYIAQKDALRMSATLRVCLYPLCTLTYVFCLHACVMCTSVWVSVWVSEWVSESRCAACVCMRADMTCLTRALCMHVCVYVLCHPKRFSHRTTRRQYTEVCYRKIEFLVFFFFVCSFFGGLLHTAYNCSSVPLSSFTTRNSVISVGYDADGSQSNRDILLTSLHYFIERKFRCTIEEGK